MKHKLLCALVAACAAAAEGAALFADDFREPPPSARPHTWWHWMNGNVTKSGITADLEAMAAVGIGGAQIFDAGLALPRGPVAFGGDAWFDCLVHADREARRLGLELCVANCSGWTSSAGPWITPELSMKFVTNTAVRVKGGVRFDGVLPLPADVNGFYEDIAVVAFPTPRRRAAWRDFDFQVFRVRGSAKVGGNEGGPAMPAELSDADMPPESCVDRAAVVDLTSSLSGGGRLAWDAPDGCAEWTVLRVGFMANGRTNRSASESGLGLECDKLDPHALDVHFDAYVGRLLKILGPDRALTGVLLDSYEVLGQNWTHGFEKEFAARAGYGIAPYLPVLAGFPVGGAEETGRFLRDYRRVISELFVENYAGRLRERCRESGLRFWCEPYGNGPFNDLAFAARCDVPMSEFWRPRDADCDLAALARGGGGSYMMCRWGCKPLGNAGLVASVAHVLGLPVVGAEAFTSYPDAASGRWADEPFAMKAQCDRVFSEGVNLMVFHRFVHQPWTSPARLPGMTMAAYGAHFDRTQTWWRHGAKEFFRYMARAQHLLRQGVFVGDVLLCTSGEAPDCCTQGTMPPGFAGDRCHPDVLAQCRVEDGCVVAPGGVRYRVVGAPPRDSLRPDAAAALKRLEDAGATVVGLGEVEAALRRLGCAPDFLCDDRDATWLHRRIGRDDMYFVAVPGREPKTVRCSFRVAGRRPELWNPVDGGIAAAPFEERDGRIELALDCEPCHSVFVVFRDRATDGALPPPRKASEKRRVAAVQGPWHVSFREPGAETDIAETDMAALASWTESGDDDIRYFSGTATYTATVALPSGGGRLTLDLGRVKNIAEVRVNGCAHPALWKPPFRLDITDAAKRGKEGAPAKIEVKVTNLWPNRLIGDARLPDDCEWDDGSNSKGYPLVKEFPGWLLRGEKSPTGRHAFSTCRFWEADAPLLESGLLGPVVIESEF